MQQPRLSIALCTYNGEKHISDQVNSLLTQNRLPDELVIGDDSSSDNTTQIIQELSTHTEVPFLIHQNRQRLGPTKNFENTIDRCHGDLIALSDQDDVWLPQKLSIIQDILSQSPHIDAVFSNAIVVDNSLNDLGYSLWQYVRFSPRKMQDMLTGHGLETLLKHFVVTGATLVIRRRLLEIAFPIPSEWMHDAWLALISAATGAIYPISDLLILYRQHAENVIGAIRPSMLARLHDAQELDRELYYSEELRRYEVAYERLCSFSYRIRADGLRLIEKKLTHLSRRSALPKSRVLRVPGVVSELIGLGYYKYSASWQVAIKDILLRGSN